eukprot:TRINITY_DN1861_c0_g1_i6.p3 TRINITY_DN1861_c0_g1~~TRINITY_DN1861_c0_g1_i6.p3  ORF type:complete len:169 (-),score=2.13 TRINITY_DN1861_c0_g1_i6:240-746(-)
MHVLSLQDACLYIFVCIGWISVYIFLYDFNNCFLYDCFVKYRTGTGRQDVCIVFIVGYTFKFFISSNDCFCMIALLNKTFQTPFAYIGQEQDDRMYVLSLLLDACLIFLYGSDICFFTIGLLNNYFLNTGQEQDDKMYVLSLLSDVCLYILYGSDICFSMIALLNNYV